MQCESVLFYFGTVIAYKPKETDNTNTLWLAACKKVKRASEILEKLFTLTSLQH